MELSIRVERGGGTLLPCLLLVLALALHIFMLSSTVSALKLKHTSFNVTVHGSSFFLMLCLGIMSDETIDRYFEEPQFSHASAFSFVTTIFFFLKLSCLFSSLPM